MNLDRLLGMIRQAEGFSARLTQDSGQTLQIGYGRNLTRSGVSRDEADLMLSNDVQDRTADLNLLPWFASLDDVRQRVLLEMAYQLGTAGLMAFSQTLGAVQAGQYAAAAADMLASDWARQTPGRAARLAAMMATGCDPS